jgi:hypothetical protein
LPAFAPWTPAERQKWALRPGFRRNTGQKPKAKEDQRALVALMDGSLQQAEPVSATSPTGWSVRTTRWTLTGAWSDVDQFKLL